MIQYRMRDRRGGQRKRQCQGHGERDGDVDGRVGVVRWFVESTCGCAGQDRGDVVWEAEAVHDSSRGDGHICRVPDLSRSQRCA